jgi:hypothetical protein
LVSYLAGTEDFGRRWPNNIRRTSPDELVKKRGKDVQDHDAGKNDGHQPKDRHAAGHMQQRRSSADHCWASPGGIAGFHVCQLRAKLLHCGDRFAAHSCARIR